MLRRISLWAATIALLVASQVQAYATPTVIKAIPDNGDVDVDPGLTELRIEFDQDMNTRAFSVCGGGPGFPTSAGEPRWLSKRVFIIPVRLEPDREYAFSVNCPAASNFKNPAGQPAAMYPITFRTAGKGKVASGKSLTAKENAKAVRELRRLMDEAYAYRDLRSIQWDRLFRQYESRLKKAGTQAAFARTAAKLLAHAKDVHIWLQVDNIPFATHQRKFTPNFKTELLPELVPNFTQHNSTVATGRFENDIGYILITAWPGGNEAAIEPAFAFLADAAGLKGLIIDVRPNSGGDESLARSFAGCFVRKPAVYSKHESRTDWSSAGIVKPINRLIDPSRNRPQYRGKVVVLVGRGVMSSCESFALMMRHGAGAKLIGDTTYGSSGNPRPHELANGVMVALPSWRDMQPDGTMLEGKGIKPDVRVKPGKGDFVDSDPVIDAALAQLRKKSGRRS